MYNKKTSSPLCARSRDGALQRRWRQRAGGMQLCTAQSRRGKVSRQPRAGGGAVGVSEVGPVSFQAARAAL